MGKMIAFVGGIGVFLWLFGGPLLKGVYQTAYPLPVVISSAYNLSLILSHEANAVIYNEGASGEIVLLISQGRNQWTYTAYLKAKEQKEFNLPLPGADSSQIRIQAMARFLASDGDMVYAKRAP